MKTGYGRGYYGSGQLARPPRKRRSWFTIVAVVGVGAAVVWMLWPRSSPDPRYLGQEPETPPPPTPPTSPTPQIETMAAAQLTTVAPQTAVGAFRKQLEDDARARGFGTVEAYEDSVVASAKQLQAAGAKVVLAPHLQHLASRVDTSIATR